MNLLDYLLLAALLAGAVYISSRLYLGWLRTLRYKTQVTTADRDFRGANVEDSTDRSPQKSIRVTSPVRPHAR
jgi:hypothetical protein